MSLVEFLLITRNLGRIFRFNAKPRIEEESVAEHSFYVALYAMIIADLESQRGLRINMERLLRSAILHDLEESMTGDILHGFKYSSPSLSREINRMSLMFYKNLSSHLPKRLARKYMEIRTNAKNPKTIEGKILEAADKLEVLIYALGEISMGNQHFTEIVRNVVKYMRKLGLKSVNSIIDELVKTYKELE